MLSDGQIISLIAAGHSRAMIRICQHPTIVIAEAAGAPFLDPVDADGIPEVGFRSVRIELNFPVEIRGRRYRIAEYKGKIFAYQE